MDIFKWLNFYLEREIVESQNWVSMELRFVERIFKVFILSLDIERRKDNIAHQKLQVAYLVENPSKYSGQAAHDMALTLVWLESVFIKQINQPIY